jgi:ubiquinone/menaquinone biosynthesis C-methylase UbiE
MFRSDQGYGEGRMKELVGNRKRLGLATKASIASGALKQNGPIWALYFGLYYGSAAVAEWAFSKMHALRLAKGLPGLNSAELNQKIWEQWDWEAGGEEWTVSEEWKSSLVRTVLTPQMSAGGHIVEIGPGAGRWTEHLVKIAGRLTGVDISQTCVDLCTRKFGSTGKARFVKTDGAHLPSVETGDVDAIWSFDVFVHINRPEVERYTAEFARVLKPGGKGVVHHGNVAGRNGGWRSDLDGEAFAAMLQRNGLVVLKQFSQWEDSGSVHKAGLYDDAITIFQKPA